MTSQTASAAARYYRVVSFGAEDGAITTDPDAAWASWERRARRRYGYTEADMGTAHAAHSARLVGPVTHREAEAADVSD